MGVKEQLSRLVNEIQTNESSKTKSKRSWGRRPLITRRRSDSEDAQDERLQRRISVPPQFNFGNDLIPTNRSSTIEDFRPHSFECRCRKRKVSSRFFAFRRTLQTSCSCSTEFDTTFTLTDLRSSLTCSTSATRLEVLTNQIHEEQDQVRRTVSKLKHDRKRHNHPVWGTVGEFLLSTAKKERLRLRRMHLMTDVARRNRSLALLNTAKSKLTMNNPSSDEENSNLDGYVGQVAEDSCQQILDLQTKWWKEWIHLNETTEAYTCTGLYGEIQNPAPALVFQQFLSQFRRSDGTSNVPCAYDLPTVQLVQFEKLLTQYQLLKKSVRTALDDICQEAMESFAAGKLIDVFASKSPCDVLVSLVREITSAIMDDAWVLEKFRVVVSAFVEQMVFSRLVCMCYHDQGALGDLDVLWRERVKQTGALSLHEVGLPSSISYSGDAVEATRLFQDTIVAFNRLPCLIPSSAMAVLMEGIQVLYSDARRAFDLSFGGISADVVLPVLVFVLSRCDLPLLHSQIYLLEQFAVDTAQEGSEAAYYIACVQAAMGYIMTHGIEESE